MEGCVQLRRGDVLVVVDVQKDFLPGGSLAVPHGDEVVPVLARYIKLFKDKGLQSSPRGIGIPRTIVPSRLKAVPGLPTASREARGPSSPLGSDFPRTP